MRSGIRFKFSPLSFLVFLLLLCLSCAFIYTVISDSGLAVFFLIAIPGSTTSLLFFAYLQLREGQSVVSLSNHSYGHGGRKNDDSGIFVRSRASDESAGKILSNGPNPLADKLAENERQLRELLAIVEKGKKEWEATFDAVPDYIVLLDREKRILRMNKTMATRLGGHPRDFIGKSCCAAVHGTETVPDFCCHGQVISRRQEEQREIFDSRLGGHLLFSMSPVVDEEGEVMSIVQIGRDINMLKQTVQDLRKARVFMQQIIDSISETLLVIDKDYRIVLANKAAKKRFLLDDREGENGEIFCYRATHGFDTPCHQKGAVLCPLMEVKKIGLPISVVHLHTTKHGEVVHEELSGTPFLDDNGQIAGIIEVGRDIDERLRFEEEKKRMIRKEARFRKNRSIGTLAGGVAHDFNNGLTTVLGNAELLRFNLPADQKENEKYLEQIITAVHKMTRITRQLLAYAKVGNYFPMKINVRTTIEAALAELKRQDDFRGIAIAFDFQDNIWPVLGDAGQLKQAVGNIFYNSVEAMKGNGGILLVKVINQHFAKNWECALNESHPHGDYVHVAIQDNGSGIPRGEFERVFEPFYSTKFMGRGLGLPAALGIIQNHGGCITLESSENHGTTFHVFLPRLKDNAIERISVSGKSGEMVLVVDDELQVLEYVETGLRLNGYDVLTAANGFEAVEKIKQKQAGIGLVILDVFMPGLDGKEVYRQIKTLRPDVRVALSSGYDEQIALAGLDLHQGDTFLAKPYDLKVLLALAERSVLRKSPDS